LLQLKTAPWVVLIVDGILSNILDLTDDAIRRALGTTTAELTGEWAYTQARAGIAPTQILGQAAFDCRILGLKYDSSKHITGGKAIVVFADHLAANKPSFLDIFDPYGNLVQKLP
jgi:hypothetical protein